MHSIKDSKTVEHEEGIGVIEKMAQSASVAPAVSHLAMICGWKPEPKNLQAPQSARSHVTSIDDRSCASVAVLILRVLFRTPIPS